MKKALKKAETIDLYQGYFLLLCLVFSFLSFFLWKRISIGIFTLISMFLIEIVFRKEQWLFRYFLGLLFVSIIVIFLSYYGFISQYGRPYLSGGSDDLHFEQVAEIYISNGWFNFTEMHGYSTNDRLYVFLIELLMVFSNHIDSYHTILPRIMNAFFLILILGKVLWLAKYKLKYENDGIKAVFLFVFFNIYFIFTAVTISRDVVGLYFVVEVLFLLHSIDTDKQKRVIRIIGILLCLFLSYYLRGQLLPILIVMILINRMFKNVKRLPRYAVFLLVFFAVLILVISFQLGLFTSISDYNSTYTDYQVARGGLSGTIIGMPLLPFGAVLRFGLGLIYPFPSFKTISLIDETWLISLIFVLSYLYEFYVFIKIPNLIKCFVNQTEYSVYYLYYLLQFCMLTFTFRHYIFAVPFYALILGEKKNRYQEKLSVLGMMFVYCLLQIVYSLMG